MSERDDVAEPSPQDSYEAKEGKKMWFGFVVYPSLNKIHALYGNRIKQNGQDRHAHT